MSNILDFSVPDTVEKTQDFTGPSLVPTGFYTLTIKQVYLGRSAGGAAYADISGKLTDDNHDEPFNERIFFTSGDAKGRKTTYERNGKVYKMPGLVTLDELCNIVTGKDLNQQATEDKLAEMWQDGERKKVSVPNLTDLEGQAVDVAIEEVKENKREQNAAGAYVPVAETRTFNTLVKVLYPNGTTLNEHIDGSQPDWKQNWSKRVGKVRDRSQAVVGSTNTAAKTSDVKRI